MDFRDDDPRCREITEGRSLDVLEIDGASNRGIEEIRELRETVQIRACQRPSFKIYIIDEVHMLTKEAFNALLKTLEEPPAHVKFMFATTEPEKVLPTILSRCQRFDLRRIPIQLIVDHLRHIAKQEKVEIDDAALHAIARGADGGMRDARIRARSADQLLRRQNRGNGCALHVRTHVAVTIALPQRTPCSRATCQTVLANSIELAKHGKDLGKFLGDLLHHLRNLLVFQISRGDTRLLEVSEAEAATLAGAIGTRRQRRPDAHHGSAHADGNASARRFLEEHFHRGRAH